MLNSKFNRTAKVSTIKSQKGNIVFQQNRNDADAWIHGHCTYSTTSMPIAYYNDSNKWYIEINRVPIRHWWLKQWWQRDGAAVGKILIHDLNLQPPYLIKHLAVLIVYTKSTTVHRASSSRLRNPVVRSSYSFLNLATKASSPSAGSSNFWDL